MRKSKKFSVFAIWGLSAFVLGNSLVNLNGKTNTLVKNESLKNDNNQGSLSSGRSEEESSSSSGGGGSSSIGSKKTTPSPSNPPAPNLNSQTNDGFPLPVQSFQDLELAIETCGAQGSGSKEENENRYNVLKEIIAQEKKHLGAKIYNANEWARLKWAIEIRYPEYYFCLNPSKKDKDAFSMYQASRALFEEFGAPTAYGIWIIRNFNTNLFKGGITWDLVEESIKKVFKREYSEKKRRLLWRSFYLKREKENWFRKAASKPKRIDLQQISYANDVLTTPFFKIKYQDDDVTNKKSQQWKKDFLKEMYTEFISSATFGNEIYVLEEIVFNESMENNVADGGYSWKDFKININFTTDDFNKYDVFYKLIREYYHHLTFSKMENLLHKYNTNNEHQLNEFYNNDYIKLFNYKKRIFDNVLNTKSKYQLLREGSEETFTPDYSQHYAQFLPSVYNYELNQYYENYFKHKKVGQFIFFDRLIPNNVPFLSFARNFYLSNEYASNEEQMARTMALVTNAFQEKENNLFKLTHKSGLMDYLMMIFTKHNIYYKYDSGQRKFPKKAYIRGRGNLYIKPEDHLVWEGKGVWKTDQIKDFTEETDEKMKKKYLEWKKYFENTFYNQDQYFSGAFRDKDNNLYIELNVQDEKITLEYTNEDGEIKEYQVPVEKLDQTGQITFNINPYDKDTRQTTNLTNHVYKIKASDLPKNDYYLKINGKYLHSGFNLWFKDKTKDPIKTIYSIHKPTWEDKTIGNEAIVAKYRFSIDQNNFRVKLEVLYNED